MVFRAIHLTAIEAAKVIGAWLVLSGFVWSVGGFIFVTVWNANRETVIAEAGLATREDIDELKTAVREASDAFNTLSRQIVILSQPENIVNYRDLPVQVHSCRAGQDACAIAIFAERDARATECRIVPQRTELMIISGSREYIASVSPGRPGTNLPASPRALEPTFDIPLSLPPGEARAVIRTYYRGCPWQQGPEADQPPVVQDSPVFTLTIEGLEP